MLKEISGGGGGSLANLAVTPEQRKRNLEKGAVTRRKNRDKRWAEIWERYQREGMEGMPYAEAAKKLEMTAYTLRRIVKWAKNRG
jgi:hypothetical protein